MSYLRAPGLTSLNCMIELQDYLESLQAEFTDLRGDRMDELWNWVERRMRPPSPGEPVIGTVTDPETLFLWAAVLRMRHDSHLAMAQAAGEIDAQAEANCRARATRLSDLADILSEVFWAAAVDELGAWEKRSAFAAPLGFRKGGVLVVVHAGNRPPIELLFGGMGGAGGPAGEGEGE